MENEVLFKEQQKFKQWWLWLILIGINGLFLFGVISQIFFGIEFGNNPMNNIGLLIVYGLILLLTFFFVTFRLETIIKSDGIYVRFFPLHKKYKYYSWSSLSKSFVRQYSALSEYGGWGIRWGLFGVGKAYNVSGNMGLQLEFTDNKKLLIGTNKSDEIVEILNKTGQLKR